MIEKSFGYFFFLKQTKNKCDDVRFIYLKITVNGKSNEISTKRKCEPSKWDARSGRVNGNKLTTKELNRFLNAFAMQVYQAKRWLMENNKELSAQAIKDVMTGNYEKPKMIPKGVL
ncbi:MAG: Arm DNA-binding domain-containing protein [Bacteroidota bacterium]|jgi:hypothetical protein|uniref:Arm DNA-binding domain-containing protein n=1 Tax=Mucilaginibacter TaxID=423349 RepID=UPI003346FF7F